MSSRLAWVEAEMSTAGYAGEVTSVEDLLALKESVIEMMARLAPGARFQSFDKKTEGSWAAYVEFTERWMDMRSRSNHHSVFRVSFDSSLVLDRRCIFMAATALKSVPYVKNTSDLNVDFSMQYSFKTMRDRKASSDKILRRLRQLTEKSIIALASAKFCIDMEAAT